MKAPARMIVPPTTDRALGTALGLLADRLLADPPDRWHPVAWFGSAMGRVEAAIHADARLPGAVYALTGAGLGTAAGIVVGALGVPGVALAVATASAGTTLRAAASRVEQHLLLDDLGAARDLLPWLVGRDPSGLDAHGVSAAVVESLAENTVDAVVAPALWGLALGAPGVLLHRAANTMDAMVGHRSPRHRRFGTVAARLDDALAWVPARAFAGLVALHALPAGRARPVLDTVLRDAPAHPSPNAGVAESAVAAALGVELGGPLRYGQRVEERPRLGEGPRPGTDDIVRARHLVDRVELTLVGGALALWWATRSRAHARSTP